MPNVPLPEWDEFKGIKPLKSTLGRRVELYTEQKDIKKALDEINKPLFEKLSRVLPESVKSFDFNGYQITPLQGEPRKTFNREALLNTTYPCPHCKKHVTVPVRVIDGAYKIGKLPKPTVVVKAIKGNDDGGEDDE